MSRRRALCFASFAVCAFAACSTPDSCVVTGCAAGTTCQEASGRCEVVDAGAEPGGDVDAGRDAGPAGPVDAGVEAGLPEDDAGLVVDPFDDGGVFLPGDICSHAVVVDFDGGSTAALDVDLAPAGDEYRARCGNDTSVPSGTDLVFAVTLAAPQSLTVTATNTAATAQDPVLALLRDPCPLERTAACADGAGSSAPEVLRVPQLPAGTWYVLLDNYAADFNGTYRVEFALGAPASAPANDACAAVATLLPNASQTVNLANALPDQAYACTRLGGGDAVYAFTLAQPGKVTLSVSSQGGDDAVLQLRSGPCLTGAPRACADVESTEPEALVFNALPAGTYFVDVGAVASSGGVFGVALAVEPAVSAPANDTCAGAEVVTVTSGSAVTVSAALGQANGDYGSDLCTPGAIGTDVVYAVELAAGQALDVTATPVTGTDVVLFARLGRCDAPPSAACEDGFGVGAGETLSLTNPSAATQTAYVFVKSYRAGGGPVDVVLSSP